MRLKELKDIFTKELENLYSKEESQTILNYILIDALEITRPNTSPKDSLWRDSSGLAKLSILSQLELSDDQTRKVFSILGELKKSIPIQYLLGTAHFYGMELKVTPDVLIPRQETEELVDWIIKDNRQPAKLRILDVCTGSGCIALALKKQLPESIVTAIDISEKALEVAKENANKLQLDIQFIKADALNLAHQIQSNSFDIIVSNPPYIPESDKVTMQKNVLLYEPHLALFVPDENPLLFYDAIARYARKLNGVTLYFEIHEEKGENLLSLLDNTGFEDIVIKMDLNGKNRMLKCRFFC